MIVDVHESNEKSGEAACCPTYTANGNEKHWYCDEQQENERSEKQLGFFSSNVLEQTPIHHVSVVRRDCVIQA